MKKLDKCDNCFAKITIYNIFYAVCEKVLKFYFCFFTGELEIKSAKASDSGLWQCANLTSGEILDQARIFVIPRFASGPFLFQSEDGAILSNSSVIAAKEGQHLALICISREIDQLEFTLNQHEIR